MCFHIDGKSAQASKCVKSRIMTNVIDYILLIDKYGQLCVLIKGKLQSPHLKCHVNTIGIDQSLSNSDIFRHRCLQNTNKLYKYSGKCDNQQKFNDIIEAAMVFTLELFTYNSPRYTMNPTTFNKPSARK